MNRQTLKKELVALLEEGQAHATVRQALMNVARETRNRRPGAGTPSVYEELAHMRLAQEDIFRYTLESSWESPPWPEGYWQAADGEISDEAWDEAQRGFFTGLEALVTWVRETEIDLTSPIPHGEGRTYLRQVLLVADHNAYHGGQIVQTRKMLGDWNPGRGA